MIVRPRHNWFRMIFVWNGSVLGDILPQLLVVAALSSFVVWSHGRLFHHHIPMTVAPFTLLGVSLALCLGFRNTASYDRYWEGRKLWGELLNLARSLTRQALTLASLEKNSPLIEEWTALLAAFTHTLRHQLRNTDPQADLARLLPPEIAAKIAATRYRPSMILLLLGEWMAKRQREGRFGEMIATAIDRNLHGLSDVLGGCERISSTPLPYPYPVMLHRIVYIYCFLLPFGLVGDLGIMTPVISVLVAYTFMAWDAIAEEIEEPFGTMPNDLALEHMSKGIESNIMEMIGKQADNLVAAPDGFVLR
jgi:ion channel-forming bestrophin family protein